MLNKIAVFLIIISIAIPAEAAAYAHFLAAPGSGNINAELEKSLKNEQAPGHAEFMESAGGKLAENIEQFTGRILKDENTIIGYLDRNGFEYVQGKSNNVTSWFLDMMFKNISSEKPVYLCLAGIDSYELFKDSSRTLYAYAEKIEGSKGSHTAVFMTKKLFNNMPASSFSTLFAKNAEMLNTMSKDVLSKNDSLTLAQVNDVISELITGIMPPFVISEKIPCFNASGKVTGRTEFTLKRIMPRLSSRPDRDDGLPLLPPYDVKIDNKVLNIEKLNLIWMLNKSFEYMLSLFPPEDVWEIANSLSITGVAKSRGVAECDVSANTIFINTEFFEFVSLKSLPAARALFFGSLLSQMLNIFAYKKESISSVKANHIYAKIIHEYLFSAYREPINYKQLYAVLSECLAHDEDFFEILFFKQEVEELVYSNLRMFEAIMNRQYDRSAQKHIILELDYIVAIVPQIAEKYNHELALEILHRYYDPLSKARFFNNDTAKEAVMHAFLHVYADLFLNCRSSPLFFEKAVNSLLNFAKDFLYDPMVQDLVIHIIADYLPAQYSVENYSVLEIIEDDYRPFEHALKAIHLFKLKNYNYSFLFILALETALAASETRVIEELMDIYSRNNQKINSDTDPELRGKLDALLFIANIYRHSIKTALGLVPHSLRSRDRVEMAKIFNDYDNNYGRHDDSIIRNYKPLILIHKGDLSFQNNDYRLAMDFFEKSMKDWFDAGDHPAFPWDPVYGYVMSARRQGVEGSVIEADLLKLIENSGKYEGIFDISRAFWPVIRSIIHDNPEYADYGFVQKTAASSKYLCDYLILQICLLYNLAVSNNTEDIPSFLSGLFIAENKGSIQGYIIQESAYYFRFFPDELQYRIAGVICDALENNEYSDEVNEMFGRFLVTAGSKNYLEYLKARLHSGLSDPEVSIDSVRLILAQLDYYCDAELYNYVESLFELNIHYKNNRKTIKRELNIFKEKLYRLVKFEPEFFNSRITSLYNNREYGKLAGEIKEYLVRYPGEDIKELEKYPLIQNAETLLALDKTLKENLDAGRFEAARQAVRTILQIDPGNVKAKKYGEIFGCLENYESALIGENFDSARASLEEAKQTLKTLYQKSRAMKIFDEMGILADRIESIIKLIPEEPDKALKQIETLAKNNTDNKKLVFMRESVKERILSRDAYLEAARQAWYEKQYERMAENYVSAVKLGRKSVAAKETREKLKELFDDAVKTKSRNLILLVHGFADSLAEVFPAESEYRHFRDRSWGHYMLPSLKAQFNIVSSILEAQKHERARLTQSYSGIRFEYRALQQMPMGMKITNFFHFTKVKNQKLPVHNVREIAHKGDAFRFVFSNGVKMVDDYLQVAEVGRDYVYFEFETIEQRDRVFDSIPKKGYFEKTEDISLVRQQESLRKVINRLENSLYQEQVTTGNEYLDTSFGLGREKLPVAGRIVYEYLNPGIKDDESQDKAFNNCITSENPVTLVQGPAGTGKTTLIVEIVNYFIKQGKRVLVVSQSHAPVNNVGERLNQYGIQYVRVGVRDEKISPELMGNWENREFILKDFIEKYRGQNTGYAVLGTNNGLLNDPYIKKDAGLQEYDVVIIEEAARATIAETLVPMMMASSQRGKVILVGDHKQLPPFGISGEIKEKVLDEINTYGLHLEKARLPAVDTIFSDENMFDMRRSLFERVFNEVKAVRKNPIDTNTLIINRRSHWLLTRIINLFYGGILRDREFGRENKEAVNDDTLVLHDVCGRQGREPGSTSFFNSDEARIAVDEFFRMLNKKDENGNYAYSHKDITLVSPYQDQVEHIYNILQLKAVLDKVRNAMPGEPVVFSEEEKSILLNSCHQDTQNDLFIGAFINKPGRENLAEFINYMRYYVPDGSGRGITLDEVEKCNILTSTVDAIQGHENKVVIISLVRSNPSGNIGFLGTEDGLQRLNVTFSRAQESEIIIGNFSQTFCRAKNAVAANIFRGILSISKQYGRYIEYPRPAVFDRPGLANYPERKQ